MDGSDVSVAQLPALIKEWMATEEDLKALTAEIREKRKRAKTVRSMIMQVMRGGKIGQLNISAGSVVRREKSTKAPMSKKFLKEALTDYFGGDAKKAEELAKFLDDRRPMKTTENLSLDPLSPA
jgi:hypothetical protein